MKANSVGENFYRVLKYIDEHICEAITVRDLARIAGYSEYYFIRMFKANMNVTVMEYVGKRRLIRASEDILAGEKIIDVAIKYGWQSHGGFTKAFKREFGFSPSFLKAMTIGLKSLGGSGMNHVFLESMEVGISKEELFALLQEKLKEGRVDIDENLLSGIYQVACGAYAGVRRYSGEEYITHLLNVSLVLTELGAEADVILAGMFCDVSQKGVVSLDSLSAQLPKCVYEIVVKEQKSEDNFAVIDDEVALIKLAERLHNMRTIEFIDESKYSEKAKETIERFIPLARRLGNKKLIDELNDLSMKYC